MKNFLLSICLFVFAANSCESMLALQEKLHQLDVATWQLAQTKRCSSLGALALGFYLGCGGENCFESTNPVTFFYACVALHFPEVLARINYAYYRARLDRHTYPQLFLDLALEGYGVGCMVLRSTIQAGALFFVTLALRSVYRVTEKNRKLSYEAWHKEMQGCLREGGEQWIIIWDTLFGKTTARSAFLRLGNLVNTKATEAIQWGKDYSEKLSSQVSEKWNELQKNT